MDKYDYIEPMEVDRSTSSMTSKMDVSSSRTSVDDIFDDDVSFQKSESPLVKKDIILEALTTNKQNADQSQDITNLIDSGRQKLEQHGEKTAIKTYHIRIKQSQRIQQLTTFQRLFYGTLLALVTVIVFPIINFKCAEEIDLMKLRSSFSENLFGQTIAANKIIETLNKHDKTKIIFFYGGTGVGKTYAVSLILESLWMSPNIYHYTMPMFNQTFSTDLMIGLSVCPTSVLVVDDLSVTDLNITPHIQSLVDKSEKLGKNITVILVYNCDNITNNFVKKCDYYFHYDLEESFKSINAMKEYIEFKPLAQEDLKKCISKELGDRKVTPAEMENILKNFDVSLDGCKGVYKKVKHLLAA